MAKQTRQTGQVVSMQEYKKRHSRQSRKGQPPRKKKASKPLHIRNAGLYVLFGVVLVVAIAVLLGLDIFCVNEVRVEGDYTMAPADIVARSGITLGDHILKVNDAEVRAGIEGDPLLECLGVQRSLPDVIILQVRQRVPYGALEYLGSYIIIDEAGQVLDVRTSLPQGEYPVITGVMATGYDVGQPLQTEDTLKMETFEELALALAAQDLGADISEINLHNGGRVSMLTREGILVEYGAAEDIENKTLWLATALAELRRQGKDAGTLFITGANGATFAPASSPAGDQGQPVGENAPGE